MTVLTLHTNLPDFDQALEDGWFDAPPIGWHAETIKDSISPAGVRLTSFIVRIWRPLLAEFNTARVFSRNSASSRAIPLSKTIKSLLANPYFPLAWLVEKSGMQGGEPLTGADLRAAQQMWWDYYRMAMAHIQAYADATPSEQRLHKSYVNRLLEPFMPQEILVTATEWENFFDLRSSRVSDDAQREFQIVADEMIVAMDASTPEFVDYGKWHRVFELDTDTDGLVGTEAEIDMMLNRFSSGRAARISYKTHFGVRDKNEDARLHDDLVKDVHASPLEHIATPAHEGDLVLGNFRGWHQYRHMAGLR